MRAGRSFLELQKAYRDGERVFPVDVGHNPFPVTATNGGLTFAAHAQPLTSCFEWTGAFPEFSNFSLTSAVVDQVRPMPCTCYRIRWYKYVGSWPRWVRRLWVTPMVYIIVVYSVPRRKPAEPFDSMPLKFTSNAKSTQSGSFPWSPIISLVLGATTMTIPAHSMLHFIHFV